jgi:hypothetical protein
MPYAFSSSHLPLTTIERPCCPKCDTRMVLAQVARGPSGYDIRTFDCAKCDHARIVTVATDPMKSGKLGWLGGGLNAPK